MLIPQAREKRLLFVLKRRRKADPSLRRKSRLNQLFSIGPCAATFISIGRPKAHVTLGMTSRAFSTACRLELPGDNDVAEPKEQVYC